MRGGANHFDQIVILAVALCQLAKHVFHHHYRAVHEDAEIDRSYGEQVGWDMPPIQADEREHQRKWNREGDDQRSAGAQQKDPQDDQYQHHTADQIPLHSSRGFFNQLAPVVIGQDLHIPREHVIVQFLGHLLDLLQHHLSLLAHAHQDDALHGVVLVHESELAQSRGVSDLNFADVADVSGNAVVARDDNIADVFQRFHESEATNVVELAALRIE